MSGKVRSFDIDEETGKKKETRNESGCFVSRTIGILIALGLIFLFVGKLCNVERFFRCRRLNRLFFKLHFFRETTKSFQALSKFKKSTQLIKSFSVMSLYLIYRKYRNIRKYKDRIIKRNNKLNYW